jgi:hypothetical protein
MDNLDDFKRNMAYSVADEMLQNNKGFERISVVVHGQNRPKLEDNVMVFQAFAYLAATQLKPSTCKVLFYFFSLSAWENYLQVDVKSISENLSITERSVMSAIKELKENNIVIITPHPSDKRRNDYFINPLAAWKGNSYSRKNKLQKLGRLQMNMFENYIGFDGSVSS